MSSRESLLKGGNSGPAIAPGNPDASLLIQAVRQTHPRIKMPPIGKLPNETIADLETWVRMGAVWPETEPKARPAKQYVITPEQRKFWSFQPVVRPARPTLKNQACVRSAIDAFILAKLESQHLEPVAAANKVTLIRRATLDLHGLPPTPAEVDAFVKDSSPDAFAKVIARLLASPRYGERWGRYWLDVARYSDDQLDATKDVPLPNAFRYRDWVVQAFQEDMPYDLFVKAQIAGDLLEDPSKKLVAGLGFLWRYVSRVWSIPNKRRMTMLAAGGGFKGGFIYGATDEWGLRAIENPVHVHDLHATQRARFSAH